MLCNAQHFLFGKPHISIVGDNSNKHYHCTLYENIYKFLQHIAFEYYGLKKKGVQKQLCTPLKSNSA